MVGTFDREGGFVEDSLPTRCTRQTFYHLAGRHSVPSVIEKNKAIYNQPFAAGRQVLNMSMSISLLQAMYTPNPTHMLVSKTSP